MARDVFGTGHGVVATQLGRVVAVLVFAVLFVVTVPHGRAASSSEITIRDGGCDPVTVKVVAGEPV